MFETTKSRRKTFFEKKCQIMPNFFLANVYFLLNLRQEKKQKYIL